MPKKVVGMEIESVIMESPNTKTIRLKWPEDYHVEFTTGQFITVYWPDAPKHKRAYSLSSCALDTGAFEITVKRDGKMGTRIHDWAKTGNTLFVIQPTGLFLPVFDPPGKHLICVAGGCGVAPYRGFIREATRRKLDTPITVLYSVRTTNDILFNEEFRRLEKDNSKFRFLVTCTRLADDEPWDGRRGRIDADWVQEQIADLDDTVFYVCGPDALVEETKKLVREEWCVPKERMKTESWG